MKYSVNTSKKTVTISSSFTYNQYTDLKMRYLGFNISVINQVCFELN